MESVLHCFEIKAKVCKHGYKALTTRASIVLFTCLLPLNKLALHLYSFSYSGE